MNKMKIIGVLCFLLIFSCNKTDEIENIPVQVCENQSEMHFYGIINDSLKCFNEGVNNYQRYFGTTHNPLEGNLPLSRFVLGLDTSPITAGDEFIYLYTPVVNTEDIEQIKQLFPKRKLTVEERNEFKLLYFNIISVENEIPIEVEYFESNFASDLAFIEVLDFDIIQSIPHTKIKVKISLNCKLYDSSGQLKKEIVSGELTGLIYAYDYE